ncbi:Histone-lysine N-methyltransferase [Hyphodiscus hymeniophilus]|uniref:Histone-lysine N-methyltransferase n=1 Tax=Hyphodiscus hymeniophilus TaxID=353542 RepID=A0A9P6VKA8_9HELO|nr:Histone-lysine N-methyltransferase [Hyphodiscus hymeniophilus]
MVSARKRGRQEMETIEPPKEPSLLERIRNMWEFANLAQWIFIFGRVVKIDESLDIEDLEMECMKSSSTILPEIGLALLKFVSSHRGLTPEIFDEYTRRQYVAKAPERNPFGFEEDPAKFTEFDTFTKIRVLQQLTQWTMGNPDRIRERMEEQKDTEQTIWRIEPFGWDSDDRTYIILDDNRLYRRTDPPPPPLPAAKPKKNSQKSKAASRASKRRKLSEAAESEAEPEEQAGPGNAGTEKEDDGFGGMKWECLAVSLEDLNAFVTTIEKSRDPNERILKKRIIEDLLPLLEKQEEARKRKEAQKERELMNLEKLATAKRSSRIAGKLEHQKQEDEAREAERKRQTDLAMAKKEQEKWMNLEKERESRMMTREQRLKEREARRIIHEEELANLSEDSRKIESGSAGRLSERHLKAEIERKKQALEDLAEEEDWIFDCICGAYGQIDDGTHSIACDKCNIWQHSKCVGVSEAEADRDDFHFICKTCDRRARDAERAKTQPPIKIKLSRPGSSSSPIPPKQNGSPAGSHQPVSNGSPSMHSSPQKPQQSPYTGTARAIPSNQNNGHELASWRSNLSPAQTEPVVLVPSMGNPQISGQNIPPRAVPSPYQVSIPTDRPHNGTPTFDVARPHQGEYGSPYGNGTHQHSRSVSRPSSSHAFSPPHPYSPTNLPPPGQNQAYSFVNGNAQQFAQNHSIVKPSVQASPSPPRSNYAVPASRPAQAPQQGGHRRTSISLPSPLSGAPLLTPSNKANPPPLSASSSPPVAPTSNGVQHQPPFPANLSPYQVAPISTQAPSLMQFQDPNLPPAITGMSPTKHSPPRPSTSNSSLGSATPSVLPPVTSLSPSPRLQNLGPPIKPSHTEVDRNPENGQSLAPTLSVTPTPL